MKKKTKRTQSMTADIASMLKKTTSRADFVLQDLIRHREEGTPIADETADFIAQHDEIRHVKAAVAVLERGVRPVPVEIHAAALSKNRSLHVGTPLSEYRGLLKVAEKKDRILGCLISKNSHRGTITLLPCLPKESRTSALLQLVWYFLAKHTPKFGRMFFTMGKAEKTAVADRVRDQVSHIPESQKEDALLAIVRAMASGQTGVDLQPFMRGGAAPVRQDLNTVEGRYTTAMQRGQGLAAANFSPTPIDPNPEPVDTSIRPIADGGVRRKILKRPIKKAT